MKKYVLLILTLVFFFLPRDIFAENLNRIIENNGKKYCVDENGNYKSGVQEVDGNKYFFGRSTKYMWTGWINDSGNIVVTDNTGKIYTGMFEYNGKKYYANESGILQSGIQEIDGKKYFFGRSTKYMWTGWIDDSGNIIITDDTGAIQTGLVSYKNKKYYINPQTLKFESGVQEVEGQKYFFGRSTKYMWTGWINDSGNVIVTDDDGKIYTGIFEYKGKKYYANNDGVLQSGVQEAEGQKYFFGRSTKYMWTGLINDGGTYYYANNDGVLQSGIQEINGQKYFFGRTTKYMWTGLINDGGTYYYANKEGILQSGVQEINGQKYFFGRSTKYMWTGWIDDYGITYYANKNGVLQSGIQEINGKRYFFGRSTKYMWTGWINDYGKIYYALEDGQLVSGDYTIDDNLYHFNSDYTLKSGWQGSYYFYANGSKAIGLNKIAGTRYLFDSSGKLLISNFKLYIDISSAQVKTYYDNSAGRWKVDIDSIDWNALKNSGDIEGIILKAGSGSLTSGKYYEINSDFYQKAARKCEQYGIPYGAYWYSYSEIYGGWDNHEAMKELELFTNTVRNYSGGYFRLGTYWDLEENSDKSQNDIMVKKFMEVDTMSTKIYCNKNYAENVLNSFTPYIEWIAHYTGSKQSDGSWSAIPNRFTDYSGNWKIWQYTDAGHVTGINGYVDFDIVR